MSLVVATEAAKTRRACGDPDTTELPEATLQAFFTEDALDWINERRPATAITHTTTVANQQDYDAKPATAYAIVDVWWLEATWLSFSPTMRVVPGGFSVDDRLAGMSVIDNPALVTTFYKKIAHYEESFQGRGYEVENSSGKPVIRLVPKPTSSGESVYFSYTFPRYALVTLAENRHVRAIRAYATHQALEYLAIKRGQIRASRGVSGGGGQNELTRSKRMLQEAEAMAPIAPMFVRV